MLNKLLMSLSLRQSTDVILNQYKDKMILNNLKIYFEYLIDNPSDIMIVGEAPGYQGCALTGIPFTSGEVITNPKHIIFKKIGYKLKVREVVSEPTATIFWDFLENNKPVPLIWNSIPFHPHKKESIKSNCRVSA